MSAFRSITHNNLLPICRSVNSKRTFEKSTSQSDRLLTDFGSGITRGHRHMSKCLGGRSMTRGQISPYPFILLSIHPSLPLSVTLLFSWPCRLLLLHPGGAWASEGSRSLHPCSACPGLTGVSRNWLRKVQKENRSLWQLWVCRNLMMMPGQK